MSWKSTPHRWGRIMQSLHWLTALLVLGLLAVGLLMGELPTSPTKIKVYALHKSIGLTVLGLLVLRMLWRLYDRRPTPAPMPTWQHWAARLSHFGLYACLLVMALSGWLYNSASNFALRWFGLFSVPPLSGPDPQLKELANEIHAYTWMVLVLLIALHVGAALKHHLVDKDHTLRAMLPGKPRDSSTSGDAA